MGLCLFGRHFRGIVVWNSINIHVLKESNIYRGNVISLEVTHIGGRLYEVVGDIVTNHIYPLQIFQMLEYYKKY